MLLGLPNWIARGINTILEPSGDQEGVGEKVTVIEGGDVLVACATSGVGMAVGEQIQAAIL
jgi:hypothetical protein